MQKTVSVKSEKKWIMQTRSFKMVYQQQEQDEFCVIFVADKHPAEATANNPPEVWYTTVVFHESVA